MEILAQILYLHAARALVNTRLGLAHHHGAFVVLILDISEYFFHKILERHQSGGAPELVNHHGHRAFLGKETAHHLVGQQRLRCEHHRFYMVFPVGLRIKQLTHVDIAQHIVDIVAIHHNLAAAGGCEERRKLFACGGGNVHGHNLVAGLHAVAQMGGGEIKGIMEYLHFRLHRTFLGIHLIYGLLQILVEVADGEHTHSRAVGLHAKQSHQRS